MRQKLRTEIINYRTVQFTLYPQLRDRINSISSTLPEEENLLLPSSLISKDRLAYGLERLANIEYKIREGRAYDALEGLRKNIQIFNHNLGFKKENVQGQGPNTRAERYIQSLTAEKVSAADQYRMARKGLLALELSPEDETLQDLRNDQLWAKDTSHLSKIGDSRREDPWFWMVGRPSGMSEKEEEEWSI